MTEMDVLGEANPDAGALVILGVRSDGTDNDDRVAVGRSGYHQLTGGGKNWREADVVVDDNGSAVFRAAGLLDDGTLVGHAESRGPGAHTASLRVEADGRWSSVVESGLERTEAFGRLRDPDQPIKLRRRRPRRGERLWTADAETRFNVVDSDGTRFLRVTTGTVKYANGAGSFRTNVVVGSIGTRHLIEDSHAGWERFDAGPGKDGFSKMSPLPGGPGNREVVREIVDRGTGATSRETTTYGKKQVDGQEVNSITKKDTFFPGAGGRPTETSTSEKCIERPDGASWTRTTTAADGSKTVERGEWVMGDGGSSMTTSTENPDHSITTQTTTWDNQTHRGEQHTVTTGPNGEPIEDTTTSGSIHLPDGTFHRPGDIGKVYEPDPESGQDGSDSAGTGEDSGTNQDDGNHHDNNDNHDDDDDSDSGEQGSGEEEGAPAGDGEGGDDTGGYPGLGWDGGSNGPLALLPALAASALGHFDDPNQPTDDLGSDTGVSEIVARAYRLAVRQGGTRGQNAGLGTDVADPLHGISEDVLLAAARKAPPVDPEWGDWSNPKAHSAFVTAIATNLGVQVKSAAGVHIASSLNKFL